MVVLADFDDTGLDVDCLALITAAAQPNVYIDSNRGGTQTPDDGELGLGSGESLITRIRILESGGRVFLNGSDTPTALVFEDYFGADNATSDRTLWVQTDTRTSSSVNLGNTGALGANYLFGGEALTDIGGIGSGDTFLLAVTTPAAADPVNLEATFVAGVPVFTAELTVAPSVNLEATFVAGVPTFTAEITVASPVNLEATFVAGTPTMTAELNVTPTITLEATFTAGVPTFTAELNVTAPTGVNLEATFAAGSPAMTAELSVANPINLEATFTSGSPSLTGELNVATPINLEAKFTAGTPAMTGELAVTALRVIPPGSWTKLESIIRENRRYQEWEAAQPPEYCPHDGSRLAVRGGIRNCPMGNYRWIG